MPTVPPALARALAGGTRHAGDVEDGARVEVEEGAGWRRAVYRPPGDGPGVEACRVVASPAPPPGWPAGAPHLPELSGLAVREGALLAVTWPDEKTLDSDDGPVPPRRAAATGWTGLDAGYAGSRATPRETDALARGAETLARRTEEDGWSTVSDEALQGPVRGRVVRWARDDRRRAMSLTESLGVVQLTFLEAPAD